MTIDQQYADDAGWVTNCKNKSKQIIPKVEQKLSERNLKLNKNKTEQYNISCNNDDNSWKNVNTLVLC